MSGRKQWNKQAATSSSLDKKLPKSLVQQGLEGSTAVGKDEVTSSNLVSSSTETPKPQWFRGFILFMILRLESIDYCLTTRAGFFTFMPAF